MSTAWISQTRETIPFEQSSQFTCRNWGVDLLRILSMFMVVVLHVLGQGGILVAQVPFDYGWVLCWTLESACFCAVNCFGIISGYVSRAETLSIRACFFRWAQVAFYSVLLTILIGVIFPNTLSVRQLLGSFFPVATQKYWYFTAYFALMFFTPFLNQLLNMLNPQKTDHLIITIFMLLCLFPLLAGRDLYYLRGGYTFLWLCALYLLGGCFRQRHNHDDSIETSTSVRTVSTTKTDHSRRIVYLCDELYQELCQYREIQFSLMEQYPGYNSERYVFCQENGAPYEPRTYQDLFKRCVSRAGIASANFHSLRHTFATRALEQGMDPVTLSKLLGHANASITLDKYGHSFESQKRAGMELMGALYAPVREPSVGPVMGF